MRIILASGSPRRKELMKQIGLDFEVMVSEVDENIGLSNPAEYVKMLSGWKAQAVLEKLEDKNTDVMVIGADTVVSCDGKILGKPADERDAARMLELLSGRMHEVYTGVTALVRREGIQEKVNFAECTRVSFFEMSREEIDGYVSTGDCLDKAGSYGIQGYCARYIEKIEGDYNNVVGLPVGRLYQEVKRFLFPRAMSQGDMLAF